MKGLYACCILALVTLATSDEDANGGLFVIGENDLPDPGDNDVNLNRVVEANRTNEEDPQAREKRRTCPSPYFDYACYVNYGYAAAYRCANGIGCSYPQFFCNRLNECGDRSDECNCEYPIYHTGYCPRYPYNYVSHDRTQCIAKQSICNGIRGFSDGSDERHCQAAYYDSVSGGCRTQFGNRGYNYRCHKEPRCIHGTQICNGVRDCEFGSDEYNC